MGVFAEGVLNSAKNFPENVHTMTWLDIVEDYILKSLSIFQNFLLEILFKNPHNYIRSSGNL